jgi:hypothetical protein
MELNASHHRKYFESYLRKLNPNSKGECRVRCPFHKDADPSLSLNLPKGLWYCFACCIGGGLIAFEQHRNGGTPAEAWEAVLKRLGLPASNGMRADAQLYDYTDEKGRLLYQVVRWFPKDFKQRRPDGKGGWIWKLDGARRVPYRLSDVLSAQRVFVPEGEKDVETLRASGLEATTNSGGAGKWRPEFREHFKSKEVVILPDNDEPGRAHAERVAASLHPVAAWVKVLALPGLDERGDVSDWLAKGGENTKERLLRLVEDCPLWQPARATDNIRSERAHAATLPKPNTSEGSAVSLETTCPRIPEAAWHGLAKAYREAVASSTEASDTYHLGAFLASAGLILGRSVHVRMGGKVYPNLYVVLVGQSGGARKTTAMQFGLELAEAAYPDVHVIRSVDSSEGLIQALGNPQTRPDERHSAPAVVRLAEFRSLLDKSAMEGLRNIIPTLCDAYDCPARLEVNTRANPVSAKEPFLSILAGTTQSWLEKLRMEDVEGGLGNRIMFYPGQPKSRIPKPPDHHGPLWNRLVRELRELHDYWKRDADAELRFSREADPQWESYYRALGDAREDDEVIRVLRERDHLHCIKTAMIWAALDKSTTIELRHLDAAILLTDYLHQSLLYLFQGFGKSRWKKDEERLIEAVRAAGERGIRTRELQRRFHRMSAEHLHRHLRWLVVPGGELRQETSGNRTVLYYNS